MQEEFTDSANFLERLELAMRTAGVRDVDLFREHGIAQSTFSRWRGGSLPRTATRNALADALGVSREWLATGRGDMTASRLREDEPEYQAAKRYGVPADNLLGMMQADEIESILTRSVQSLKDKAANGQRPTQQEIDTFRSIVEALADKHL